MTITLSRLRMPLILWSSVTLFFAFQFILRLSAGILREDIMKKFSIDTIAFGHLAGYYYLGYAGMQIPLGYMLDRYSFRLVTFISILTTSLGALTFSCADDWNIVLFGRFLIGAGSAVAFLSIVKVTKTFFPEKYQPMMIGFAFTFGLTGAVVGGSPTKLLFETFGYDLTLQILAFVAVIIGVLIIAINDKKIEKFEFNQDIGSPDLISTLKLAFNPTILSIGIYGGFMVGSLEGFTDVWAITFFNQVYGYNEYDSINATSIVYTGMCFGGPLLAFFADKFKSNIFMILVTGVLTSIIFIILFSNSHLNYNFILSLMFGLGILCCYQVLVFTLTADLVSKSSTGIAIAMINCINMSFGHFFHVGISNVIQNYWDGKLNENSMPFYDHNAFVMALSPIPVFCLLGTLGFLYLSVVQKSGKLKKIN